MSDSELKLLREKNALLEDRVEALEGRLTILNETAILDNQINQLGKQAERLRKNDEATATHALSIVTAYQALDKLGQVVSGCPGFTCCPCNVRSPGECTCNEKCGCSKNSSLDMDIVGLYARITEVYREKLPGLIKSLEAKIK